MPLCFNAIVVSVRKLIIVMLTILVLNVIMPSVFILNVIVVGVVAPLLEPFVFGKGESTRI
jgi:hypothetical protein